MKVLYRIFYESSLKGTVETLASRMDGSWGSRHDGSRTECLLMRAVAMYRHICYCSVNTLAQRLHGSMLHPPADFLHFLL
jgi:hypothetical protein